MKYLTIIFSLIIFKLQFISQNRFDTTIGQKYISTYIPINLDLYERSAREISENKKLEAQQENLKLKELYLNASNLDNPITNGFHNIEMTNGINNTYNSSAYVENGKILYLQSKTGNRFYVSFSSTINKGKSLIRLSTNNKDLGYYDIYFIEDIYK